MQNIKIIPLKSDNPYTEISIILQIENINILLDAGKLWSKKLISPSEISAIFISHAHIEHIKGLISIINLGYKGKVYSTETTKMLLRIILEEYLKSYFSFKEKFIKKLIEKVKSRIISVEYGKVLSLNENIDFRFKPAYHTFGSSFIEIDIRKGTRIFKKIVYTGDLGATETPLLLSPKSPWRADILIMEGANLDIVYPDVQERRKILKEVLSNNRLIIVPEYSVGRVEEFIFEINRLFPKKTIIFDTPAHEIVEKYYLNFKDICKDEILLKLRKKQLIFKNLRFIKSEIEHKDLLNSLKSLSDCIIIVPPPCMSNGRSYDYLKYKDDNFCILNLTKTHKIPAKNLLFLSSHADRRNLTNFVKRIRFKPEKVVLFHSDIENF